MRSARISFIAYYTLHSVARRKILVSPWKKFSQHSAWNPSCIRFLKSQNVFTSRTSCSVRLSVCLSVRPRVCFLGGDLQRMLGLAREIWLIPVKYIPYNIRIHAKIKLHIFCQARCMYKIYTTKDTKHYPRLHSFHITLLNVLIISRNARQDTNLPCEGHMKEMIEICDRYEGKREIHAEFWWGNLREKDHLEGLAVDWETILK
jgi:hypothetical protein